jgi:hypothetical protein
VKYNCLWRIGNLTSDLDKPEKCVVFLATIDHRSTTEPFIKTSNFVKPIATQGKIPVADSTKIRAFKPLIAGLIYLKAIPPPRCHVDRQLEIEVAPIDKL